MSIEVINEALELLRITQSGMGPDPGYLDRYDRHHWHRISRCRQELEKLKQQEPAKYEFQNRDGTWHGFLNESHYQNTVEDGSWPIRALYAAPVPAALELVADDLSALVQRLARALRKVAPDSDLPEKALDYLRRKNLQGSPLRDADSAPSDQPPVPAAVPDGWRTLVSDVLAYFDTPAHDFSAEQEQRLIVRLQTMLSAAPAAPAVQGDVAKDAERYRWLRDRLAIEDIDRLVSEFFGTPDEAESVKTDAAIDAAMQKGGE